MKFSLQEQSRKRKWHLVWTSLKKPHHKYYCYYAIPFLTAWLYKTFAMHVRFIITSLLFRQVSPATVQPDQYTFLPSIDRK